MFGLSVIFRAQNGPCRSIALVDYKKNLALHRLIERLLLDEKTPSVAVNYVIEDFDTENSDRFHRPF